MPKEPQEIRTTGQLRAMLGRMLAGVEAGTVDHAAALAACKVAATINQSFAEETKAVLAAKELGALKISFGYTEIGEPGNDQKAIEPPRAEQQHEPAHPAPRQRQRVGSEAGRPLAVGRVSDD